MSRFVNVSEKLKEIFKNGEVIPKNSCMIIETYGPYFMKYNLKRLYCLYRTEIEIKVVAVNINYNDENDLSSLFQEYDIADICDMMLEEKSGNKAILIENIEGVVDLYNYFKEELKGKNQEIVYSRRGELKMYDAPSIVSRDSYARFIDKLKSKFNIRHHKEEYKGATYCHTAFDKKRSGWY